MKGSGRGATRGTSHTDTMFGEDIWERVGEGVVHISWRESGDASASGVFEGIRSGKGSEHRLSF